MELIGFDFTLPEPRVIIALPAETKLIHVGDLKSLTELAPPKHRALVRAVYRVGFICGDRTGPDLLKNAAPCKRETRRVR